MSDSLREAILRELDRAYPAPVTLRSLRSLVDDEHSRDELRDALAQLQREAHVTEIPERGLVRYRRTGPSYYRSDDR